MSFAWIPGTPPNSEAIERLKQHFPKPDEPPPEAWFMGDISYWRILEPEPQELTARELEFYFQDTSSGLRNFPGVEFAVKSWKDTFHYLLPHLLPRVQEGYLLAELIGYFIHIYPETIPDLYPKFRSDILQTLGTAIMAPEFWNGADFSDEVIERDRQYWLSYGGNDFISIVSPALYFCLKYLTPSEMETWCESLFQISGIHWHYNLMFWLYQETISLFMSFDFEGEDLPNTHEVYPAQSIGFNAKVKTIHLPTENMRMFIRKLKEHHICYAS